MLRHLKGKTPRYILNVYHFMVLFQIVRYFIAIHEYFWFEGWIEVVRVVMERINWIYIIAYGKISFGLRMLRFIDNLAERITYVNRGSTVFNCICAACRPIIPHLSILSAYIWPLWAAFRWIYPNAECPHPRSTWSLGTHLVNGRTHLIRGSPNLVGEGSD